MDGITIFNQPAQALRLLSSSYDIQKKKNTIPANIVLANGPALFFDDVFLSCKILQKEKVVTAEQYALLEQLDSISIKWAMNRYAVRLYAMV